MTTTILHRRTGLLAAGSFALLALAATAVSPAAADEKQQVKQLAEHLRQLSPHVLPEDERKQLSGMVREDQRRRLQAANRRSSEAWANIKSRQDWEKFRALRIDALRKSLGQFPDPPKELNARVTGKLAGEGYRIHNVVFESRPGLWVTANLYLPAKPPQSMPGILICHSHHRPKEHGELQDMGMTWARAGCLVLVMDQLGHGERRQHPFRTSADYDKEFAVSRQDYYFRYDTGIQLHLAGDSLVGWMARDMMRGVDLLLAQPGIDPKRIALLGAVAGGGDPAAVTAAVDERIAAAVPFNFGGPQPETRYPLPDDAETSFNYAGGGSWESTRNLRLSAAGGFLPWVIVGGIAPRRLIFAHEFNWDRPRDPVWKRLEKIYALYDLSGNLSYTHGRGELRGRPPEATHCTHIGKFHRRLIHATLKRWFDIEMTTEAEYSNRRESKELLCLTPEVQREVKPQKLHELLMNDVRERTNKTDKKREALKGDWSRVLGNVEPGDPIKTKTERLEKLSDGASMYRLSIEVEPGIEIPSLLLVPARDKTKFASLVVGLAQAGKEGFLRHRAAELAELLSSGVAVCLPDLRGIGESRSGSGRGRYSSDTGRSSTELMLGGTMVGARLRDLRAVLKYLRSRDALPLDATRMALWGDSFAAANPPDTNFKVPRRVEGRAKDSEPLGGLLALLGALYEDDVHSVYIHGGLSGFDSVLASQFVHIPHDTAIPGALTSGDLPDLAAALAPRPLRLEGLVDGLNRTLPDEAGQKVYNSATVAYRNAGGKTRFSISASRTSAARWLLAQLANKQGKGP